jgi:hypothetical protein
MSGSPSPASRGSERLLWDCATVGRVVESNRASARARLEAEMGHDIARLLLLTLREPEPSTPHEEQLWRAAQGDAA